jgi:multiple sugar transport system permease protein
MISKKTTYIKNIDTKSAICYIILAVGGLVVLYPLIFMVLAGLFTKEEYASTVISLLPFPKNITYKNFIDIFSASGNSMILVYLINSIIRVSYVVVTTSITSLFCGYAFARLKFKWKKTIFLAMLLTTMIPGTVTLIPTFIMYARWPLAGGNFIFSGGSGILDTFFVYIIGGPAINIMATFFVKQYIETIPFSIDEAARIDGSGIFRILFKIIFPIARPAFGYIAITTAIGIWNDWATSFFFTSKDSLAMLPTAISRLSSQAASGSTVPDYPQMISIGLLTTIPALIIYFIFQKNIVEGVAQTGIKG